MITLGVYIFAFYNAIFIITLGYVKEY